MNEEINHKFLNNIYNIFIPSSPVINKNQCYGRFKEINQISRALNEKGKHVLLFGGRGYGKTSISNIVTHNLKQFSIFKINCHRGLDTFTSIWKEVIKKIGSSFAEQVKTKKLNIKLEKYFTNWENITNQNKLGIVDVISFFKNVNFPLLIILDEADLIVQNPKNLAMFADLIKCFSDQIPYIKLLIIGIADNSYDFIGEHTSLERCLIEVKVDRMDEQTLMDILEGGLLKIGMNATPEVKKNLVLFAHGLPFYIHLISLYAIEEAIELKYKTLVGKNFQSSVIQAIENMKENLNKSLLVAVGKSKGDTYLKLLEASVKLEEDALAEQYYFSRQDPQYSFNYNEIRFTSQDISSFLYKKKQISINDKKVARILNLLSSEKKGAIIQRFQDYKVSKYCFASPLFRAYLHYRMYEKTETSKPVFFVS